ncbi:hypothetical protein LPJ66_000383 [Kickxella alabastrina]|uniref:Uncharacterized protein n=1 Tax=Kickxella alabastrina TaxID=61397 RepID=A0ACC1IW74_9FUNG|nr:hypothetical protein LPJ66_000383 [Kickxella alabastrina]
MPTRRFENGGQAPSNVPPEVISGSQNPTLQTLNPPLHHLAHRALRLQRAIIQQQARERLLHRENNEYDDDSGSDTSDFVGALDTFGHPMDYPSDMDSPVNDSTHDEDDGEEEEDEHDSDFSNDTFPSPLSATSAQVEGSNLEEEQGGFSDDDFDNDEFISINTQFNPMVIRQHGRRRLNAPVTVDFTQSLRPAESNSLTVDSSPPTPATGSTSQQQPEHQAQEAQEAHAVESSQQTPSSKRRHSKVCTKDHDSLAELSPTSIAKKAKTQLCAESDSAETVGRNRVLFKCAVCLDTPDPAVFVDPCGHVFCEGCAQGAVQSTRKCPVCRHAMRAKDIRVLQFRVATIGR